MSQPVLAAIAWPYANSEIHVGNLTSSHLPGDIIARYHRLQGHPVLMVSGSDSHGTPTTIRADAENITPLEVYQRYHTTFLDLFQKMGISYDLFTSTHTENHSNVSQAIFKALLKNGLLYTDKQLQWFSPAQNRFLPDRYVEGTCYICGFTNARSDQCDNCGNLLDPTKLIDPRSKIDGSKPELRETTHYYLDLAKLQGPIENFLKTRESFWRPNVINQSLGQMAADKLHGRPITRDLDWGIPVPVKGWEGKCLYVWFEAVIGYLSASIEWARLNGTPEAWRDWWQKPESQTIYFIGKDNIPFHAIIWPGELLGAGAEFDAQMGSSTKASLVLPYNIPATEWMNLEGQKISGSRNWAVWGRDFLSRYDPDPLRYYLTVNMPETRDSDWDWEDFRHRNNDELLATWGNLANRVLTFTCNNFDNTVPEPGKLDSPDKELLQKVKISFEEISAEYEAVHLRSAIEKTMDLAREGNKYWETCAPWRTLKTDRSITANTCFVGLQLVNSLKILFSPVLPFTSEKLHIFLGYKQPLFGNQYTETIKDKLADHTILRYDPSKATGKWEPSTLAPGTKLVQPAPLYKLLDPSIVDKERSKLGPKK
jgi:methionyl-tRNA synthetase